MRKLAIAVVAVLFIGCALSTSTSTQAFCQEGDTECVDTWQLVWDRIHHVAPIWAAEEGIPDPTASIGCAPAPWADRCSIAIHWYGKEYQLNCNFVGDEVQCTACVIDENRTARCRSV